MLLLALALFVASPLPTPGPSRVLLPTLVAMPADAVPLRVPDGFRVALFAEGLTMPREMAQLPGGAVLVTESGAGRVRQLVDGDGDGRVDAQRIWLEGLDRPYGILLHDGWVYVANTDAIVRARVAPDGTAADREVVVPSLALDGAPFSRRGHWTRDVLFSRDGTRLFVSVGSASNNDADEPPGRGAVLVYDDGRAAIFASGLRNPVSLARRPGSDEVWTTVNERDRLGNDLVPDFVTSLRPGGFYGWPFWYIGAHADPRWVGAMPANAPPADSVVVPDVLLPAHSAALGLAFYDASRFAERYHGGLFVGLHGSTNRDPMAGYAVAFIPFCDGRLAGAAEPFLTGFVGDAGGAVYGRPVAPFVAADGALLISDDAAGRIWRVTAR